MSKKRLRYLSKMQVDILIKYYYIKKFTTIAKMESLTTNQVKQQFSNALVAIRLAYSPLYKQGLHFDAAVVLRRMAENADLTEQELCDIFRQYISEGLTSKDRRFWEHVAAGQELTPLGLLSFLWAKFEADIMPVHTWDLFGK